MLNPTDTPLDTLSSYISKIADLCKKNDNLPQELQAFLEKASSIISELTPSTAEVRNEETGSPGAIYRNTAEAATEDVKPTDIQVYKMLLQLTGARDILHLPECPSATVLSLGDLLPEHGKLVLRTSEQCRNELGEVLLREKKIHAKIGSTADILKELLASGEQFDMVFIGDGEENHRAYYNLVIGGNMLKRNGIICLQNTSTKEERSQTHINGARNVTNVINEDPDVEQVILPTDCGITVLKRKPVSSVRDGEKGIVKDDVFWGYNRRCILDRLCLDGKVAYVTGGGQGIGRAFAHALGEAGAKVAIVDMVLEKAEAVAYELQLKGIKSVAMAADVSKEEDVRRIVATVVANWGRIDIACNNAGINMNSASEDTTLEEWDKTFNVNLRGLFMCCQAAGRVMLKQGYGKIINTASMASLIVPHPQKQLAYNTSKAGVVKLTQTLGTEWIDRGVRVNCISPGIVDTPLIHTDALKPLVERWLSDIPAGRLAQVTDLQAAVVFLASEASDYMTGHNLVIEGGQSLW
ncbi:uncharacterized protein LOC128500840 [Spea bombifrons]|uniref:uncharacterized protein LOC128500840 n=1 Tax=Spea bombifrons TaxID=233779 RepID=UPI00234A1558|nr:uncharacterized protein LOC128500840 [Spea bombifrons]